MVDMLILHIGTHKTGTTAIQGALSASREKLLEKNLLYPKAGRGTYGRGRTPYTGHANLAREAGGWKRFEPEAGGADDVVAEANHHEVEYVLLSAEDFSVPERIERRVQWVRRLGERLGTTRVRIVVYLRPQWEYMESSYAELVRSGNAQRPFPGHVGIDIDHPRFDYSAMLEPWSEAFGQVDVHGYSGYSSHSVVDHFAREVLELPLARPNLSKRPNRRAGEKTIEMLRCLRGLLAVARADSNLSEVFIGARQLLREELPDQQPFRGLTSSLRTRISEHFQDSNDRVLERYDATSYKSVLGLRPDLPQPSTWRLHDADSHERAIFTRMVGFALKEMTEGYQ